MSSPFQRAFSSKSPLKQTLADTEPRSNRGSKEMATEYFQDWTDQKLKKKEKPNWRDMATGPMKSPLFPAKRMWEKAKKVYQAIDTPEERTALKNKVVEAWKNIKGPRSTRVGN